MPPGVKNRAAATGVGRGGWFHLAGGKAWRREKDGEVIYAVRLTKRAEDKLTALMAAAEGTRGLRLYVKGFN